jgi:hypothetical protein
METSEAFQERQIWSPDVELNKATVIAARPTTITPMSRATVFSTAGPFIIDTLVWLAGLPLVFIRWRTTTRAHAPSTVTA